MSTLRVASRPRAFVRVVGRDAIDYLQRMLSNDVPVFPNWDVVDALLLTPKGRVIAPVRVLRDSADDDFILLTEPELGERVRDELLRMRFAAKCDIELEHHDSYILFGEPDAGIPNDDYGILAREVIDEPELDTAERVDAVELERMRIEACTPRWGYEIDETILPAEAGLDETHISFTKGCYPGQEPIARLHHRGHVNRRLRVLEADAAEPGDELSHEGKVVGRVTSAVPGRALAYVRTEVPAGAALSLSSGGSARLLESK